MRISANGLVLALAMCAVIEAANAAEDQPATAAIPQEPAYETEGVVRVVVDFARTLVLARPASTVIIGNPGIAQATLSDDKTVILTGKMPGSTNLIVMDTEGAEIANLVLNVVAGGGRLITVDEGNGRATYSCDQRCDPVQTGKDPGATGATSSQTGEGNNSAAPGAP